MQHEPALGCLAQNMHALPSCECLLQVSTAGFAAVAIDLLTEGLLNIVVSNLGEKTKLSCASTNKDNIVAVSSRKMALSQHHPDFC